MLVISRRKNEEFVFAITPEVARALAAQDPDAQGMVSVASVAVVEFRGDKVRLGITADHRILVHRREVYDAIHGIEREEAVTADVK